MDVDNEVYSREIKSQKVLLLRTFVTYWVGILFFFYLIHDEKKSICH